jgi:hypothetical protein
MIRLKRSERKSDTSAAAVRLLLAFVLAAGLAHSVSAQNIWDTDHTREFAQYLMQSQQYQLASNEWERVLFFHPDDTLARLNLIRSFRLGNQPGLGWMKLNQWYPVGPLSNPFSAEALQLSLMLGDYGSFRSVLDRSTGLTAPEKGNYLLGSWLMQGSWIRQSRAIRQPSFPITATDPNLLALYARTQAIHRKSPALAVTLSAIVPGMGKVYSHDWKDGLFSLLFVVTSAWQSYRGFSRKGVQSAGGWIFGTLATGFYTANLFGSWKSATGYNSRQTDLILHETEGVVFTR